MNVYLRCSLLHAPTSPLDWLSGRGTEAAGTVPPVDGHEYNVAREEADQENKRLRGANPLWDNLELHDVHPIMFGETPADLNNNFAFERRIMSY
jgi:hypothetical protein